MGGDEPTYGQKAVAAAFNTSDNEMAGFVREYYAKVIDTLNDRREYSDDPEVKRLCSIAITEAQTAQMWAVKALTFSRKEK